MSNTRNSRFQRGSGMYQCESCKRKTRATGGDNDSVKLCEECWEIAGLENQISDNSQSPEVSKWEAEITRLTEQCRAKGGTL